MASLLSTLRLDNLRKEEEQKIKDKLFEAYRHKSDGNTHAPDGTLIDTLIVRLEKELKIHKENK